MKTPLCAVCRTPLVEDKQTEEHVIPQAIGGRRTVKDFVCVDCNNRTGNEWDKEAVEQLRYVSVQLGIRRQQGETPPVNILFSDNADRSHQQHMLLHPGGELSRSGKPIVDAPDSVSEKCFSVEASTLERAEKIAYNLERRYLKMGAKTISLNVEEKQETVVGKVSTGLTLGGEKANRSHVKSVLAFAQLNNIPAEACELASAFLRGENIDCIGLWYKEDVIISRKPGDVFHGISILGDPQTGRLLGYLEHYGTFRYVIILSENYRGSFVECSHFINPRSGKESATQTADLSAIKRATGQERIAFHQFYCPENMGTALTQLNTLIQSIVDERHCLKMTKETIHQVLTEMAIKPGTAVPENQVKEFSQRIAEVAFSKLTPIIAEKDRQK